MNNSCIALPISIPHLEIHVRLHKEATVMETSLPPPNGPQQATAASLRTPYGIGDLPPEVLLNIFQLFNVQQLDGTISPVCRLWRDLSQRPCLRLKLKLEGKGPDTSALCDLLRSCPNLKDLSICDRDDVNHVLHHVTLYNHDLRRLAVNECGSIYRCKKLSEQVLDEILLCCPRIVDMTITESIIQSNKFFRDLGIRLPELRRINFNYTSSFGPDELRMIVTRCRKLEEICAVNRSPPLYDEDIHFVAERLCETLKVLQIEGDQLSDEGIAAVGQCYQLRKVYIRHIDEITDDGVFHLSRLQNLDDLQLTESIEVTSCGWVKLFFESHWRQMKNLTLYRCFCVDDDVLLQVATACPNLVKLELTWCDYSSDVGLASVLQKCADLEDLEIWTLHEYVFRSFYYIPLHTRKLKRLMYTSHGLNEENRVFRFLKETIPECNIIRV